MRLKLSILCCLMCFLQVEAQRMVQATRHIRACEVQRGFVLTYQKEGASVLLGYSDECTYEEACRNPLFGQMLEQMERQADKVMSRRKAPLPDTFGPIFKPADVKEAVGPLCTDVWDQYSSPYFDLCPVVDGDTCMAGCVATALAQTMRYHRWPKVGKGSHTYNDSTGCNQVLTADFASHQYDWDYMLDDYSGTYSKREGLAVAQLMSDCGIAVNMKYGTGESGARSVYQAQALVNYFDYDPGLMMRYRNFYTQVEWDSIMFHELSEGRPIIVSGWSPSLGHSFICDGYDAEGYFHVNFGNVGGYGNGYYYFTFLTPDMPEYYNYKDSPEFGFNLLQCITTGVRPRVPGEESAEQHLYAFSHITPLHLSPLGESQSIDIVVHNLSNIGWNKHEERVGIALKPEAMGSSPYRGESEGMGVQKFAPYRGESEGGLLYTYDREFLLEEVEDTTYTDTLSITLSPDIADGTYRIVPVYEDNGKWVEARTMVGVPNYLRCRIEEGQVTVEEPTDERFDLQVTDLIDVPDTFYHWTRPAYTITLHNAGSEYSGRFYVALYTDDTPDVNIIIAHEGLSLGANETVNRTFKSFVFSKHPEGTYHLRIMADVDLFTDSLVTIYDNPDHDIIVLKEKPTGIEDCQSTMNNEPLTIYDLSGRRITNAEARQRRQPVIVSDGKKFRKILH